MATFFGAVFVILMVLLLLKMGPFDLVAILIEYLVEGLFS